MRQKLLDSKIELIQAFTANMIAFEERTPEAEKALERPKFILQQVNGMLDTFISFFAPDDVPEISDAEVEYIFIEDWADYKVGDTIKKEVLGDGVIFHDLMNKNIIRCVKVSNE